ncbi:MAG TPA: hypothetical protein VF981_08745 [Gemmatimonadaceae bacterium]
MNDRQPGFWMVLRRRFPLALPLIIAFVALTVAADSVLALRYLRYRAETERLREGMTEAQRERTDLVVEAEEHRFRVETELLRRQVRSDQELHLAVNVDSGRMILERDGVTLREMPVRLGPERLRGAGDDSTILIPPLGKRTIARVLNAEDAWDVPALVYQERGLPTPENRQVRGALGSLAIVLNSGTVLYAVPESGPLADSSIVLPGSVRASRADLRAIAENLKPGTSVYFYR